MLVRVRWASNSHQDGGGERALFGDKSAKQNTTFAVGRGAQGG